jgi:hypothetical protein
MSKYTHKHKPRQGKRKAKGRKWSPVAPILTKAKLSYPPLPKLFHTQLKFSGSKNGFTPTGTIGLSSFFNQLPLFSDQFYAMYNFCRIRAVDVHLELLNSDNLSYDLVIATVPYSLIPLTVSQLKEANNSTFKTAAPYNGINRVVIRRHFATSNILGITTSERELWQNITQARSTSPIDTELPVIFWAASPPVGTPATGVTVSFTYTYHCEFFDLVIPALSTIKTSIQDFDEIDDDTEPQMQPNKQCRPIDKPSTKILKSPEWPSKKHL